MADQPSNPPERLQSVRPQRDLTLDSKQSRFVPKIPVRNRPSSAVKVEGGGAAAAAAGGRQHPVSVKVEKKDDHHHGKPHQKQRQPFAPRPPQAVMGRTVFIGSGRGGRSAGGGGGATARPSSGAADDDDDDDDKKKKDRTRLNDVYNRNEPICLPFSQYPPPEEFTDDPFIETGEPEDDDESSLSSLLLNANEQDRLLFIQLPSVLPSTKVFAKTEETRPTPSHPMSSSSNDNNNNENVLNKLPPGVIGKMVVRRSGKTELRLGGCAFHVLSGTESRSSQIVMAIPPSGENCFELGPVTGRLVVMPNVDALLRDADM